MESSLDVSRLRLVVTADLPPLEVDPVLIAQALANLLENAARHNPPGAEIVVEASLRFGRADTIELAVSDSGPGVPPEQRELIFDLFHRGAGGGGPGSACRLPRPSSKPTVVASESAPPGRVGHVSC